MGGRKQIMNMPTSFNSHGQKVPKPNTAAAAYESSKNSNSVIGSYSQDKPLLGQVQSKQFLASAKDLISSYKNLPQNLHSISEKNESDKTKSKRDKQSMLHFLSRQVTMRTLGEQDAESQATGASPDLKVVQTSQANSIHRSSENQVEQSSPPKLKQRLAGAMHGQISGKQIQKKKKTYPQRVYVKLEPPTGQP